MEQNIITPENFVAACRKEGKIYIPRLKGYEFNQLKYIDAAKWLVKAIKGDIQDNPDPITASEQLEIQNFGALEGTISAAADRAYEDVLAKHRRRGLPITKSVLFLAEKTREHVMLPIKKRREEMKAKAEEKRRLTSFDIYPKVDSERYTITNENQILSKMYYYDSWSRNSLFYIASLVRFILEQIGADEFKRSVIQNFGSNIKDIEFKGFKELDKDIQDIVADQINMAVQRTTVPI